jgi:cell wall-associated NlpC family hydrolase
MAFATTLLSVVPIRLESAHRSEMVSQLLFGEFLEVQEEEGDFTKVKCLYDNYEGWMQTNQLQKVATTVQTNTYIGKWAEPVVINNNQRHLSFGTPFYSEKQLKDIFTDTGVNLQYPENITLKKSVSSPVQGEALSEIYNQYLGTPYLWGGRSVFGIDCSGFVQQVFKFFNIKLLRDAYLQAEQGQPVSSLEQTREGDLAFFCNDKGRVTHVGIILEGNRIVHSSGRVRIDSLDQEGIVNVETGKRTHTLHSMRTYS